MRTLNPRYTYTKQGVYYFTRSVPSDLKHMYARPRIVKSLRTKSRADAKKAAEALAARLNDHWLNLRLAEAAIPGQDLLLGEFKKQSALPLMSDCLDQYIRVKGHDRPKTFYQGAKRNIGYLIAHVGDKPLDHYTPTDGATLRDKLLESGLGIASLQRVFGSIRAIINFCIRENGLDCRNVFTGTYLPPEVRKDRRKPLSANSIALLQKKCRILDDDIRWLLALVSDTGMRLAEATGLLQSDISLDSAVPYVRVQTHAHRRLKTDSSDRVIPLVGASLWAAHRIREENSDFCFPRYTDATACNSNSASAAANKWLKAEISNDAVIHGLRHSMRDRLREVQAPSEIVDEIGGWSKRSVGQSYGNGYPIEILHDWMTRIALR